MIRLLQKLLRLVTLSSKDMYNKNQILYVMKVDIIFINKALLKRL